MKVIPEYIAETYRGVLIVESTLEGISLRRLSYRPERKSQYYQRLALSLPISTKEAVVTSAYPLSLERFKAALELLQGNNDLSESLVIFGSAIDPFLPSLEKLSTSLSIIQLLCCYRAKHVVIQTRSPHVLLATPSLASLPGYFTVAMGIETLHTGTARTLTPNLPLPLERLDAIKTLKTIGIKTLLSLLPISVRPQTISETETMLKILDASASEWCLLTPLATNAAHTPGSEPKFHPLLDRHLARYLRERFLTKPNTRSQRNHLTTPTEHSRRAA